jgi:hypothetical protein
MNLTYKGKTVERHLNNPATPIIEGNMDDLSFVKLHSTLRFLMTRFHKNQCPKIAHFIVRYIGMVIEHPDAVDSPDGRTLYLQLLQQWQNITAALLEQRRHLAAENKNIHSLIQ